MVKVCQASDLRLHQIKEKFQLQEIRDRSFFLEWQTLLPELPPEEQQWLDQMKTDFLDLIEYPLHEEIVKLAMLAPLMMFAGLLRRPFLPVAEQTVEISLADADELVRGKIDVLVLLQHLWVVVIESKRKGFNVLEALPQALVYMLDSPIQNRPLFGMITNGSEFRFIKLIHREHPQYALSDLFTLQRHENDLYAVLKILKRLGDLASGDRPI
jgi:hypothetical protein